MLTAPFIDTGVPYIVEIGSDVILDARDSGDVDGDAIVE